MNEGRAEGKKKKSLKLSFYPLFSHAWPKLNLCLVYQSEGLGTKAVL